MLTGVSAVNTHGHGLQNGGALCGVRRGAVQPGAEGMLLRGADPIHRRAQGVVPRAGGAVLLHRGPQQPRGAQHDCRGGRRCIVVAVLARAVSAPARGGRCSDTGAVRGAQTDAALRVGAADGLGHLGLCDVRQRGDRGGHPCCGQPVDPNQTAAKEEAGLAADLNIIR